jgi:phosphohistidine phosphatase
VLRYEPRVYEASVLGLLMLVREFSPEWRTALIVGHNPGLAELTVGLADPPPDPPSAFPTAAVAVLDLRRSWAEAGPGEARLVCFRTPR